MALFDRFTLIAGPCLLEDAGLNLEVGEELARIGRAFALPIVFKASFDKANRSRPGAARGPGLEAGLPLLAQVGERTGLPLLTDVHEPAQCGPVADVVNVLQIPAFLCRKTDLGDAAGAAAGRRGGAVHSKKGPGMAPAVTVRDHFSFRGPGKTRPILNDLRCRLMVVSGCWGVVMPKYVDGYVVPVKKARLADYRRMARKAGKVWIELGALEYVECVAEDVKKGKVTSFPQALQLKRGEVAGFSWIIYKSRKDRDRINQLVMEDPRMQEFKDMKKMPFDTQRMFWGGFSPIVSLSKQGD